MKKPFNKIILASIALLVLFSIGQLASVSAQTSGGDFSPQTQKYIDNLNEVQEAQNGGQPINSSPQIIPDIGFWKYVIYGAMAGAFYGFWRWVKSLRS